MTAPSDFQYRLNKLFDGRLRIRWSYARDEWHIEYKIAPGQVPNCPVNSEDDRLIRARDGYAFIMSVRGGDRMPCPICKCTISVPVMKTGEAVCGFCRLQGRDGRYVAAYYPLDSDALIQHLSKLDPYRGWRTGLARRADEANARILAQKEREFENTVEAVAKDNILDLFQIPRISMGGVKRFGES